MGSHLLGLRDPSQLQELRKSNNMKLPLILAATVSVSLADPHYLRSYGVGPIHRLRSRFGSFGSYGDQAFRSALASQAFRNNLVSQSPVSTIGSYNALGGDLSNQGNFLGYTNGAQLKTYSNYQNYLTKSPVPFSEPTRVDNIIPATQVGSYFGKQLEQIASLPAASAGLAYMRNYFGKDDLCGELALAYTETILGGGSGSQAMANAEAAFKDGWSKGARILPGSPCSAAEVAFKEAYASGDADAVMEAALAFVNNWPGLQEGNPCYVSSKAYMDAILAGNSVNSAGLISGKAFIAAVGNAFIDSSNLPGSASVVAAKSFIDSTLSSSSSGYDPVCAASALAYMDASASGKNPLTSGLIAAKAFFQEYTKGASPRVHSPCVKAALGFAASSPSPYRTGSNAMVAFVNQAVKQKAFLDPVCGAASIAFLDAKIAGKSDEKAGAAAAEAYIESFASNGGRRTEACKRAAEAFVRTL